MRKIKIIFLVQLFLLVLCVFGNANEILNRQKDLKFKNGVSFKFRSPGLLNARNNIHVNKYLRSNFNFYGNKSSNMRKAGIALLIFGAVFVAISIPMIVVGAILLNLINSYGPIEKFDSNRFSRYLDDSDDYEYREPEYYPVQDTINMSIAFIVTGVLLLTLVGIPLMIAGMVLKNRSYRDNVSLFMDTIKKESRMGLVVKI